VRGRADEGRLGEVPRDARELVAELAVVEGEAPGGKERLSSGDRALGVGGREGKVDVRSRAGEKLCEPLVVEGRDRTEARVTASELSPAGAGLFYLERCRQDRVSGG